MREKEEYERPAIVGKQEFEVRALACNKVPGLGATNFCGQVGNNSTPAHCGFNPNSRSS